jgi:hypothetical protein
VMMAVEGVTIPLLSHHHTIVLMIVLIMLVADMVMGEAVKVRAAAVSVFLWLSSHTTLGMTMAITIPMTLKMIGSPRVITVMTMALVLTLVVVLVLVLVLWSLSHSLPLIRRMILQMERRTTLLMKEREMRKVNAIVRMTGRVGGTMRMTMRIQMTLILMRWRFVWFH